MNPLQTDPEKKCESKYHRDQNNDTALFIRDKKIIRLCTSCITDNDEPLNKQSRFLRRRVTIENEKKTPRA